MNKIIQYLLGGAAIVIIIAGLKLGADIINQILLSTLIAICIVPFPEWLTRKGLSKGLAITISLLVVLAGGFLTAVLLTNSITGLVESFPVYEQKLTVLYNEFLIYADRNNLKISEIMETVNISPDKILNIAGGVAQSMTNMISSLFVIAMLLVFIVIEMVDFNVDNSTKKSNKALFHNWIGVISLDLRKYISITALKGIITAILNLIFLLIMGVDFAFLWALFSFFMNFIPNLGIIFSFIPPALIALIMLGPWQALTVLIAFWLINFIVENVIGPIFMKESLNISLLNSFLSLLIWGWILGMNGAILGVPLTMVVMKIFKDARNNDNDSLQENTG
ncbi:MAG TPA: AI-2E family transporter [Ignavibacteriaceae bacterium]